MKSRSLLFFFILLSSAFAGAADARPEAALAEEATRLVQQADRAREANELQRAQELYEEARTGFLRLQRLNPDYKPQLVALRLEHCQLHLGLDDPTPDTTPPAPVVRDDIDYKARYDALAKQARAVAIQARAMKTELEASKTLKEENEALRQRIEALRSEQPLPATNQDAELTELRKRLEATEQALEAAYAGSREPPSGELEELRKSLATLKREKQSIEEDAETFRAKSVALQDKLTTENRELQETLMDRERGFRSVEERNEVLEDEVARNGEVLQALRTSSQAELESLRHTLSGLQASNELAQTEILGLRETLEQSRIAAEAQVANLPVSPQQQEELQQLRDSLTNANARVALLEQDSVALEELVQIEKDLRAENQHFRAELHAHTNHLTILEMELEDARALAGDLEAQAARVEEFQKSLTEESMAHRATKKHLVRLKDYIQELRDQVARAERQQRQQNDAISDLQDADDQRKLVEEELRQRGFDLKEAATREAQAKADLGTLKEYVKKLEGEHAQQKTMLEDMTRELAEVPRLTRELKKARAVNDDAARMAETLADDLRTTKEQLARLKTVEKAFNENQEHLGALEDRYGLLTEAYQKLEKELAEARDGVKIAANLHEHARALEKLVKELEDDNGTLAGNLRTLEAQLSESQQETTTLRDQLRALQDEATAP